MMNLQIQLASRPQGVPTVDNFKTVEVPVPELKDGQVNEYTITPEQFGMAEHDGSALRALSRQFRNRP